MGVSVCEEAIGTGAEAEYGPLPPTQGATSSQALTSTDKLHDSTDHARLYDCHDYLCKCPSTGQNEVKLTTQTNLQLPMSFIASFFAINIHQFPKDQESGEPDWPLSTVATYICMLYRSTLLYCPMQTIIRVLV